jgi:hypothetical protein
MPSKDLLEKLFDVEREAEALVAGAREEAGRRLDAARTKAQRSYTEAYDQALAKAVAERRESEQAARDEYEAAIVSFRKHLDDSRVDKAAFFSACDAALGRAPSEDLREGI